MTARVGVNLLWLVPGVVGGSEESTLASVRALQELAPGDMTIELFVGRELATAHPDVVAAFRTSVFPVSSGSRAVRIVAESTWLAARTRRLDLVHHAGGTAPPLRSAPYVLTVHDLQPLEHDATHGRLKRAYLAAALPRSVRSARAVVVPSEFVRRSLLDLVGADPARVHVVPHGVTPWPAADGDEVRRRYDLDGPIVLYPAITYPHKNHAVLVEAFARIVTDHPDALLVLSGAQGAMEADLAAQARRLRIEGSIRRLGRIPRPDLGALYEQAAVVAVPSRYEGFGLPAAEAMAFGAPLVAAAATALPEVVGDAGVLVDPDDVEGWAAAIGGLLAVAAERQRLAQAGRHRASRFTWATNAERLVDVYRQALSAQPGQ